MKTISARQIFIIKQTLDAAASLLFSIQMGDLLVVRSTPSRWVAKEPEHFQQYFRIRWRCSQHFPARSRASRAQ